MSRGAVLIESDAARYLYPLLGPQPLSTRTSETLLVRRDGPAVVFLSPLRRRAAPPLSMASPDFGTAGGQRRLAPTRGIRRVRGLRRHSGLCRDTRSQGRRLGSRRQSRPRRGSRARPLRRAPAGGRRGSAPRRPGGRVLRSLAKPGRFLRDVARQKPQPDRAGPRPGQRADSAAGSGRGNPRRQSRGGGVLWPATRGSEGSQHDRGSRTAGSARRRPAAAGQGPARR